MIAKSDFFVWQPRTMTNCIHNGSRNSANGQDSDQPTHSLQSHQNLSLNGNSKRKEIGLNIFLFRKNSMYNIYCDNINTLGYERKQNAYIVLLLYI